jgi:hypothetical protein
VEEGRGAGEDAAESAGFAGLTQEKITQGRRGALGFAEKAFRRRR